MLSVRYSLQETGPGWTLYEQDAPLLSPMGHPVATVHRSLAERLLESVRTANDQDDLTPFSLQVWYLDFGCRVPVEHLRASVLSGLDPRWDVACNAPADPRLSEGLRRAYRSNGEIWSDGRTRERVDRLSRRALLTVAVFSARFQSARLGLLTIDTDTDRERLALGTCRLVAERRVGRGLHGDPRYLAPALGAARELLPRPLPEPRRRTPGGRRGGRAAAQPAQLRGAKHARGRPPLRELPGRVSAGGAPQRARPPGGP